MGCTPSAGTQSAPIADGSHSQHEPMYGGATLSRLGQVSEMERAQATEVQRTMIRAMALLNESVATTQVQMTNEDFIPYKQKIAEIMGTISVDVLGEIYQDFPDLEPQSADAWRAAGGLNLPYWLGQVGLDESSA